MHERSTAQHGRRFPQVFIRHAVWLYLRVPLSYRDVEELLSERRMRSPTRASGAG
jgi:putative transposase